MLLVLRQIPTRQIIIKRRLIRMGSGQWQRAIGNCNKNKIKSK